MDAPCSAPLLLLLLGLPPAALSQNLTSDRPPPAPRVYEGVRISVVMPPSVARSLSRYITPFYDQTGCQVDLVTGPADSQRIEEMVESDGAAEARGHDGYALSSLALPSLAEQGLLRDLTGYVREDQGIAWEDIMPFFAENNAAYNGRTYGVPFDGGSLLLMARRDLVPQGEEPETIEELLGLIEELDGSDFNGDGIPDRGWCECLGVSPGNTTASLAQGEILLQFAAAYMQSRGTGQGFAFNPDDMAPPASSPGFRKAFEMARAVWRKGTTLRDNACHDPPPNQPLLRLAQGVCAFTVFPSGGLLDRQILEAPAGSLLRHIPFPGAVEVEVGGELVACTPEVCPFARRGRGGQLVNRAPFAARGGWVMSVGNHSMSPEAVYGFFSFLNSPLVSTEWVVGSEFEPFRRTHLVPAVWEGRWGKAVVADYLSAAYATTLGGRNVAADTRLPGSASYVMQAGAALDEAVRGELSISGALLRIDREWNAITQATGLEKARRIYRNGLGMPPFRPARFPEFGSDSQVFRSFIIVVAVVAAGITVLIAVLVYKQRQSQKAYLKQYDNNVVAENCARAIASMRLDEVAYLKDLESPNGIQAAFITIVDRIEEYKSFMPQSLFAGRSDEYSTGTGAGESDDIKSCRSQDSLSFITSSGAAHSRVTQMMHMTVRKRRVAIVHIRAPHHSGTPSAVSASYTLLLDMLDSMLGSAGGVLHYTTGNTAVATWGAMLPASEREIKACRFALTNAVPLQGCGVGIASGTTIAGTCGSLNLRCFFVEGTPVTLARSLAKRSAQLQGHESMGLILASEEVFERTVGYIMFTPLSFVKSPVDVLGFDALAVMEAAYRIDSEADHDGVEWMYQLNDPDWVHEISGDKALDDNMTLSDYARRLHSFVKNPTMRNMRLCVEVLRRVSDIDLNLSHNLRRVFAHSLYRLRT